MNRSLFVAAAGVALLVLVFSSCASGMSRADLAAEYFNIGNAFLDLDQPDRASEYFVRALDLDPDLRVAEFNLARAYMNANRYIEARGVLEDLLEIDPDNTIVLKAYGYVLYQQGSSREAEDVFGQVVMINPSDVDAWFNRALIARQRGDLEEADSFIGRARELDRTASDVSRLYALVQYETGTPNARELLEEVHAAQPDDLEILEALARSAFTDGDYAVARDLADDLVNRDPAEAGYRFLQARVAFIGLEDTDLGVVALRQALERDFQDVEALNELLEQVDSEIRDLVEALMIDFGFEGE